MTDLALRHDLGHMPRVFKALNHMVRMSEGELKGVKSILDEFGL